MAKTLLFSSLLYYFVSLILDLIFPKNCLSCHRSNYYLCPDCFAKIPSRQLNPDSLSLFRYHSHIKQLIALLKFSFTTDLVGELSQNVVFRLKKEFPNLLDYWRESHFILLPIPLHSQRQNWRGFNQSTLISRSISQKIGLNFSDQILSRPLSRSPQSQISDRSKRLSNITGVFFVQKPPPSKIILFDDVKTSGSTLASAANAIRSVSPNSEIFYFTLAA